MGKNIDMSIPFFQDQFSFSGKRGKFLELLDFVAFLRENLIFVKISLMSINRQF